MAYALMTSGGKDSILALDRAREAELDVRYLVTFHDGATGRVRFHGEYVNFDKIWSYPKPNRSRCSPGSLGTAAPASSRDGSCRRARPRRPTR